jgi:hypothetical protein
MKKHSVILLALLMTGLFTGGAFSAEGDEFSTTSFRIDSNGQVWQKNLVETATTSDTLTAAESGKTIAIDATTGWVEMTLPDAAAGLTYRIVAVNGGSAGTIYVDPQDTDYIRGCVGANDHSAFAAGDSIYSAHTTGDSVTLLATCDSVWNCVQRTGTWSDGGTSP